MSEREPRIFERARGPQCARLFELRRFAIGELEAAEKARIAGHLESCGDCRARSNDLAMERETFAREVDVPSASARLLERLEAVRSADSARTPWGRIAGVFARQPRLIGLAAVVILCLVPVSLLVRPLAGVSGNRLKGAGVGIEMFVNDPSAGARLAGDGVTLHAGDQIQFRYRAAGRKYVFVVSVGEGGAVSPLYPNDSTGSIRIAPSGTHVLDGSIILDDSRGAERILALFSERPLSYEEVKVAVDKTLAKERDVTRLRALDLGREDVDEATVLINKE